MDRRTFLRRLGIGIAVQTVSSLGPDGLDLDRLLWVPGEKTIFLPSTSKVLTYDDTGADVLSDPPRVYGANNFLTIEAITRETLRVLENNLKFTSAINRAYDMQFATKAGSKIVMPVPVRYR